MNELVTVVNGEALTTTLTVAEGLEVQHKNIIELVRTYQSDLEEFGPLAFETRKGISLPQGGFAKATEVANLNEHQATLIMTYAKNTEIARTFKKRLVKAFYELAAKARQTPMDVLNDPAAMRGLLLTYTEKVLELQEEIKVMQPKLSILNRITASEASVIPTLAAKILDIAPKKFFKALCSLGWIYKRNGGVWIAKQECITKGFLENKYGNYMDNLGNEKTSAQVLVTPLGMTALAANMDKVLARLTTI